MKKLLLFTSVLLGVFTLASCGSDSKESTKSSKPAQSTPESSLSTKEESTVAPTVIVPEGAYTAKVTYPDGSPVTSGVSVQWCSSFCYLPVKVNEDGLAYLELDDNTYHVHLNNVPEGYTYNPNIYNPTASNKHVDIELIELKNAESGEGTIASPYVVGEGTYRASITATGNAGIVYYTFEGEAGKTYEIESMTVEMLADNEIDIAFGDCDPNNLSSVTAFANPTDSLNFTYSFDQASSYAFALMINSATSTPAVFDFTIRVVE